MYVRILVAMSVCSQCLCCNVHTECECFPHMGVRTPVQAYSVYDREVGYCQGSPFIAGVLLLHVRGGRGGEGQVRLQRWWGGAG